MDANHQDKVNNNLTTIEDVEWVLSKRSKLLIPQHKNQKRKTSKVPFNWLNLIGVFLVPFVVTVIGLYATQQITFQQAQFTQQQASLSNAASEQQHQTDIQIAQDQQRETILEAYISSIQDLLLNYHLRIAAPSDEVSVTARARTLTVLRGLDAERKRLLILFLYEANLINKQREVISLNGAFLADANFVGIDLKNVDLSGAYMPNAELASADLTNANLVNTDLSSVDLEGAILKGANLSRAFLLNANLYNANLERVNLSGAVLERATFSGADLSGANLKDAIGITTEELEKQAKSLKGAIMPNGSVHP